MLHLIPDVTPIAIPTDAFGVAGGVIVTILLAGLGVLWRDQQKRADEKRKRDEEIWQDMRQSAAEDRQQRDDAIDALGGMRDVIEHMAETLHLDVKDKAGRRRRDDP